LILQRVFYYFLNSKLDFNKYKIEDNSSTIQYFTNVKLPTVIRVTNAYKRTPISK